MKLTQDQFETKYEKTRNKLISEGISIEQLNRAEFCEIYNDEDNVCSDEWIDLFEDIARNT